MTTPMLRVEDLVKSYQAPRSRVAGAAGAAVDRVSLDVAPGEFFTLLGPSGCGKTTTLRSVAGLETPDAGQIRIGDLTVFSGAPPVNVPVWRRNFAMVFQSYAIWPHMTVAQNVAFPLKAAHVPRAQLADRVAEALRMVDLAELADRPATALSGGQQQRVAFARAVVRKAQLLLLDEPLSNLDAKLRVQMRDELRSLQQQLGTTTVYVTHDQEEALTLSDRIAVMRSGRVVEIGEPEQLYLRPRHAFTAEFIGQAELWPARVVSPAGAESLTVDTPFGKLAAASRPDLAGGAVKLLARPEHLRVHPTTQAPSVPNLVPAQVTGVRFTGKLVDLDLVVGDQAVRVQELAGGQRAPGDSVLLEFPVDRCVLVAAGEDGDD